MGAYLKFKYVSSLRPYFTVWNVLNQLTFHFKNLLTYLAKYTPRTVLCFKCAVIVWKETIPELYLLNLCRLWSRRKHKQSILQSLTALSLGRQRKNANNNARPPVNLLHFHNIYSRRHNTKAGELTKPAAGHVSQQIVLISFNFVGLPVGT